MAEAAAATRSPSRAGVARGDFRRAGRRGVAAEAPVLAHAAVGDRLSGVDAARIIAAMGTVWVHSMRAEETAHLMNLGRFGVPFFAFIAAWFLVVNLRKRQAAVSAWGGFAAERWVRLYVPFLVWTGVYFVAKIVNDVWVTKHGFPSFSPTVLLTGDMAHLWFLPFLLLGLVGLYPVLTWGLKSPGRSRAVGLGLLLAGIACALIGPRFHLEHAHLERLGPWEQNLAILMAWIDRLPALLWGAALGLIVDRRPSQLRMGHVASALAMLVLAFCLAEMTYFEMRGGVAQNVAGLALVVIALGPWLAGLGPIVARLATYAFGVYLCHMLFTELVKAFRIQMGWERTFPLDVARWAIAVGGSFVVVHLLRSNRYTRWLIPGH